MIFLFFSDCISWRYNSCICIRIFFREKFYLNFLVINKFLAVVISLLMLILILFGKNNIFIISQSLVSIYSLQSFIFIAILGSILLGVLFVVSKVVTMNDGAIKL